MVKQQQQLVWLWRCERGQGGLKEREKKKRVLGALVQEDAALDGLAADGALAHSVPAQLAGAMAAHEDHVLQPVQAHWTHGLETDEEKYHSSYAVVKSFQRPENH